MPNEYTIERLSDPKVMAELLYRSQDLSDEAFEDLIDDIGLRATRIVLRASACSGDVKAADLYRKWVEADKAKRKRPQAVAERNVMTSAGMVVPARPATD